MLYVTAIYQVYSTGTATTSGEESEAPEASRPQALWDRFAALLQALPRVHLFHEPGEACPFCAQAPRGVDRKVTCTALPFQDLETVQRTAGASPPTQRCIRKDTLPFLQLMCAKTEFLRRACADPKNIAAVAWIDAGVTKVLSGTEGLRRAVQDAQALAAHPRWRVVVAPGCWDDSSFRPSEDADAYVRGPLWRFCGGFLLLPVKQVDGVADAVLRACCELVESTGRLPWEVNVWAYLEARRRVVPWRWWPGDHNDRLFECVRGVLEETDHQE